jgi:hypothetical protein
LKEGILKIKNWHKFQHFKDRKPPWIKLYRDLLDDIEWHELDPAAAKILTMLWLIASENHGEIPPVKELSFRFRLPEIEIKSAISKLYHWIDQPDITTISEQYQNYPPERETETERYREETEKISCDWPSGYQELFWKSYPRKVGKKAAFKKLDEVKKNNPPPWNRVLKSISEIRATELRFVPHPATWLNQGRWDDETGDLNGHVQATGNLLPATDRLIGAIEAFGSPERASDLRGGTGETPIRLISKG